MFSFFCSAAEFHHILYFFLGRETKIIIIIIIFFAVKHVLLALTHGYNNALLVNVFEQLILIRKKNVEHGMKENIVFRKKFLNLFWL